MTEPRNKHGLTDLHLAAYDGDLEWVQDCLTHGLDKEARDKHGNTPLHWATAMSMANGEREEVATTLIAAGCDVNARRSGGETILMNAVAAGNRDVIRQLLQAGADASLTNDKGETAQAYTSFPEIEAELDSGSPRIGG